MPFSASSAIAKELICNYEGRGLLHKHANIPALLKLRPDIDLNQYFVFAVYRNPVDIVFSIYNKMLTNANGVYTNPSYFLENGGHVSKVSRRFYELIHKNNSTFEDYLISRYTHIPYDSYFSDNRKYLDFIIDFDNLNHDFQVCLQELEINLIRDLPLYNKTAKKIPTHNISRVIEDKVFGAFIAHNSMSKKHGNPIPSFLSRCIYVIFRYLRAYRWLKIDIQQSKLSKSLID